MVDRKEDKPEMSGTKDRKTTRGAKKVRKATKKQRRQPIRKFRKPKGEGTGLASDAMISAALAFVSQNWSARLTGFHLP